MIQEQEFKQFESKYIKLNIGEMKFLTVTNWRVEMIKFEDHPLKPKLIMQVLQVDQLPSDKIFQTGNRDLIFQLKPVLMQAQAMGKTQVMFALSRSGEKEYRISSLMGGA